MMAPRRLLLGVPLVVAAGGGVAFWSMLRGMAAGTFDPRGVPSPIIGHPVPAFGLPGQMPGEGFGSEDLASGKPVMLNFFASWCVPCVQEHANLMAISKSGIPIYAVAYKDGDEKAAQFIARHGDPYQRIARDSSGRVAIDFGVSGVPETFLVDGRGIVRWHWAGPLDSDTIRTRLEPAWRALA